MVHPIHLHSHLRLPLHLPPLTISHTLSERIDPTLSNLDPPVPTTMKDKHACLNCINPNYYQLPLAVKQSHSLFFPLPSPTKTPRETQTYLANEKGVTCFKCHEFIQVEEYIEDVS